MKLHYLFIIAFILIFMVSCVAPPVPAPTPTPTPTEPTQPIPEELPPTPAPSPPRPETPFVIKEEGILFQEDFEDGRADGWALEEGWGIEREGDNHVLSGRGHRWADPRVRGWYWLYL